MPPNILWVCTDQQRYDTIGALGYGHYSTPHMDSLVERGTTFTHTYCQSPICTPSRASFLTGMYASAVHVNGNGLEYFPDRPPLVTRMFADVGYDCGLIGKLHLATASQSVEPRTDDGYRYWEYSHAPRDDWPEGHGYSDWVRSKGAILGDLVPGPDGVPAELHQTTWCAEKTIEFITEKRGDQPWLASVNIYDPHPPFNAPRQYREMFDPAQMPGALFRSSDLAEQKRLAFADFQSKGRNPEDLDVGNGYYSEAHDAPYGPGDHRLLQAGYAAMIKLVDDQLGRILAALDKSGQRDNTIVIFTSDHGETLGDHGLIQKGCRFYEGLVRVPLIFSWPGHIQENQRHDDLVELSDKAPTLLELCGQEVPERMTGKSLAPILTRSDAKAHREFVRCEYYDALKEPDGTFATMYRDERWKLCVYHGRNYGELYDLQEDPDEFENLWEKPETDEKKAELLKRSFDESMLAMDRGPRRVGAI
ncbi:MAG: sulfatase-like hydrolase/transferase [Candidatus Latescibacterota bacterium]|nr:sulfatase-like hydrolase/transferase [Candidatus Latescibacterota bacterium]